MTNVQWKKKSISHIKPFPYRDISASVEFLEMSFERKQSIPVFLYSTNYVIARWLGKFCNLSNDCNMYEEIIKYLLNYKS